MSSDPQHSHEKLDIGVQRQLDTRTHWPAYLITELHVQGKTVSKTKQTPNTNLWPLHTHTRAYAPHTQQKREIKENFSVVNMESYGNWRFLSHVCRPYMKALPVSLLSTLPAPFPAGRLSLPASLLEPCRWHLGACSVSEWHKKLY